MYAVARGVSCLSQLLSGRLVLYQMLLLGEDAQHLVVGHLVVGLLAMA